MSFRPLIAIDFDGTLVAHEYPSIGREAPGAVAAVLEIQQHAAVLLWTMRDRERLAEAVEWCRRQGIVLTGANCNALQGSWTSSPKMYAHAYVDDAAIGCPLIDPPSTRLTRDRARPMVDWARVMPMLRERFGWPVPAAEGT